VAESISIARFNASNVDAMASGGAAAGVDARAGCAPIASTEMLAAREAPTNAEIILLPAGSILELTSGEREVVSWLARGLTTPSLQRPQQDSNLRHKV
jgi:hypothetical protein